MDWEISETTSSRILNSKNTPDSLQWWESAHGFFVDDVTTTPFSTGVISLSRELDIGGLRPV